MTIEEIITEIDLLINKLDLPFVKTELRVNKENVEFDIRISAYKKEEESNSGLGKQIRTVLDGIGGTPK